MLNNELTDSLIDFSLDRFNEKNNTNFSLENYLTLKDGERSTVLRVKLQENNSFILKIIKENKTCGFNDYAGLKFLSGLDSNKSKITPEFYYGNSEKNIFIFEDLKTNINLESILKSGEHKNIKDYFLKLSDKTAELNIVTYGKKEDFYKVRNELPSSDKYGLEIEDINFTNGIRRVEKWFNYFNINISNAFFKGIEIIREKYINYEKLISFTNGDFAPSNNLIKDNNIFLIDFEYCGYRSMFYDILVWETLCPLEENLFKEIKNNYLNKIADFLHISTEEIEKEYNYIFFWRALTMLSWLDINLLEKDSIWAESWTRREAMISILKRIVLRKDSCDDLKEIIKPIEKLLKILKVKFDWREDNLYPKWL